MVKLNLRLFEEGAAGGGDAAQSAPAKETAPASVVYGKTAEQPVETSKATAETKPEATEEAKPEAKKEPVDRVAAFEKFIQDNKDLYSERVKAAINERFKGTKALEDRINSLNPVLDLLASRYKVDGKDIDALARAVQSDDSLYEAEAQETGMTVEQIKRVRSLERENAEYKRMVQESTRRSEFEQKVMQWRSESETLKQVYPSFDLDAEFGHPETGKRFAQLLDAGVGVKAAYEVIHKDDIIGGAMQYTAEQVQKKVVNDILARGSRPDENGTNSQSSAVLRKTDVSQLTKKDREEISRRVLRGEKIIF